MQRPIALSASPGVDNTDALQALIDLTDRETRATAMRPVVLTLPYHPDGFRVDRTLRLDGRSNLVIRGESTERPFKMWTPLTGQEAYPHPYDADPENHVGDTSGWLFQDGERTWRTSSGGSYRRHWVIAESETCSNITLQHIHVTGPNTDRIAEAPNYSAASYGQANLWESREAEHGFHVGRLPVSGIRFVDCHTVSTYGDGFCLVSEPSSRSNIVIQDCTSQHAGRHSITLVGGWGVRVRRFTGTGSYSSIVDIEPNSATMGMRDVALVDIRGNSYRIPLLVQNGHVDALSQDITIDQFEITDHGYHATVWYPPLYADTTVGTPTGKLTVRGLRLADGVSWDCDNEALICVTGWPEVEVADCELGFSAPRASSYGVRLTNVASHSLSGNVFTNAGAGDLLEVTS